uniref:Conjugal transfer protein TrbJ n=1 Tax=mine drainage metagenome TaxID=410659 RepID=E6QMV3_9ZZZZ
MRKIDKILIAAGLILGLMAPASAQWAVLDVANLAQNYATAAQTLEQYITQLQELQNSYQQLQALGKDGPVSNNTLNQVQYGLQTSQALEQALGNGQNAAQNLTAAYGASGSGSFAGWISSLNQQGSLQGQSVNNLAQAAVSSNQAVSDAQKQWYAANSSIDAAAGTRAQLTIVNRSLMTLIQQNQATNQALSALVANEAQKTAQQDAPTMSGAQQAAEQALQNNIQNGNNWMTQTYGGSP